MLLKLTTWQALEGVGNRGIWEISRALEGKGSAQKGTPAASPLFGSHFTAVVSRESPYPLPF